MITVTLPNFKPRAYNFLDHVYTETWFVMQN